MTGLIIYLGWVTEEYPGFGSCTLRSLYLSPVYF